MAFSLRGEDWTEELNLKVTIFFLSTLRTMTLIVLRVQV